MNIIRRSYQEPIPENFTGKIISEETNTHFYVETYVVDGKIHREDGLAMIYWKSKSYDEAFKSFRDEFDFYLKGILYKKTEEWFEQLTEEQKIQALFNIVDW